jgi:hypothetical protein
MRRILAWVRPPLRHGEPGQAEVGGRGTKREAVSGDCGRGAAQLCQLSDPFPFFVSTIINLSDVLFSGGHETPPIGTAVQGAMDAVPLTPALARDAQTTVVADRVFRDGAASPPRLVETVQLACVVIVLDPSWSGTAALGLGCNGQSAAAVGSGVLQGVEVAAEV